MFDLVDFFKSTINSKTSPASSSQDTKCGDKTLQIFMFFIVMALCFATVFFSEGIAQPTGTQTDRNSYDSTPVSFSCSLQTAIPQAECEALTALYESTNGANWTNNAGWLQTDSPCSWYGVGCAGGHVTSLDLSQNQLSGTIPSELANLTNLQVLYLYRNELSGSIPKELGNLSNLRDLLLDHNRLSGTIPPELGNLRNLQDLRLNTNELNGNIAKQLGNLDKLQFLYLGSNQLIGSIPAELGNLLNLEQLYLDNNRVTGNIPSQLGNLASLKELSLYNNQLTGNIPLALSNLSKLRILWLTDNQLSGEIPPELGNLTNLEDLHLNGNELTGIIPTELGNLTKLFVLSVSRNKLTGGVPQELDNLTILERLALHENPQLTGALPLSLTNLTKLWRLWFQDTDLCEPPDESFQTWLAGISELQSTDIICGQEISVTSPAGGERWLVEEMHEITWTSSGVTNIKIEYRAITGTDWIEIEPSWPASGGSYSWEIPNLTSNQCRIKISSVAHPRLYSVSDIFTINGWILTRLVGGTYEEFKLDRHALRFGNSGANMWPESWWRNFDYTTYPYNTWPWEFSEPPINARSETFPDWPLFAETFGTYQCYFEPPPGLVIYKPTAILMWRAIKDGILNNTWGGSCAGFAISSFAVFDDKSKFVQKFPDLGYFSHLWNLWINDTSRKVINQLWLHQFGRSQIVDFLSVFNSPIKTLNQLKEMFLSDTRENSYLVMWSIDTREVHAVNPYRIERDENNADTWYIYVYDNNAPNDTNRRVTVMKDMDKWMWAYPLQGWINSKGLHLMGPAVDFLARPIFPELPLPPPLNKSLAQPDSKISGDLTTNNEHIVVYNSPAASIVITDQIGRTIGNNDSMTFNNFDDAVPIIPITSKFQPPIGYFLPEGKYDIKIQNVNDSLAYFTIFDDSTVYSFEHIAALSNQTDQITYSEEGFTIINEDEQNKNFWLQTIIAENDHEKVFQVNNFDISPGDSLQFENVERRELRILNLGAEKKYDLTIQAVSAEGAYIFEHSDVTFSANTSQVISPNWNDLEQEPVQILIDEDLDGEIDDSLFVENQVVNVEEQKSQFTVVADAYFLEQNYPNPFNASTSIRFGLHKASEVKIEVFNTQGQRVATVLYGWKPEGNHTVTFHAGQQASGLYLYRIQAGDFVKVRKMILIK